MHRVAVTRLGRRRYQRGLRPSNDWLLAWSDGRLHSQPHAGGSASPMPLDATSCGAVIDGDHVLIAVAGRVEGTPTGGIVRRAL